MNILSIVFLNRFSTKLLNIWSYHSMYHYSGEEQSFFFQEAKVLSLSNQQRKVFVMYIILAPCKIGFYSWSKDSNYVVFHLFCWPVNQEIILLDQHSYINHINLISICILPLFPPLFRSSSWLRVGAGRTAYVPATTWSITVLTRTSMRPCRPSRWPETTFFDPRLEDQYLI